MKKTKTRLLAIAVSLTALCMLPFCAKHDQTTGMITPVVNTDTLNAVKGTPAVHPQGGSAWDGTVEAAWNNAPKLTVQAVVPDLGNGTFAGFIGNSTDITMRSMYDANNIYFLIEYTTAQKNVKRSPWYYSPATKQWVEEDVAPTQNADGTYRPAFAEDRFLMMFNISCPAFNTLSCYAACHAASTYSTAPTTGGNMRTNGPAEVLDVWTAGMVQALNVNQADDDFIDDGSASGNSGLLNNTAVNTDNQANSSDGGFDNSQTLNVTGTGVPVQVPLWIIPSGSYTNGGIMIKETLAGGAAVQVTAVDSNGVLTLSNGSSIDPRTGTDYKQIGALDGPKCIPGSVIAAFTGSRGDVTANAFYTGTSWRLLFKRALKTSDSANDVDFSSLGNQPFGVAAMFNGADNEHAIMAGLILHFNK